MKILVVTQYFYPEEFKINDLVKGLVDRGHEVVVLTCKPNYPKGKFYKGYKFWGVNEETLYGAKVIRVPVIPRGNGKSLRLVLNYFSLVYMCCATDCVQIGFFAGIPLQYCKPMQECW